MLKMPHPFYYLIFFFDTRQLFLYDNCMVITLKTMMVWDSRHLDSSISLNLVSRVIKIQEDSFWLNNTLLQNIEVF